MSTTDTVNQLLTVTCAVKEHSVAEKTPFRGAVHFWRGGEAVAIAFPVKHERDLLLDFAQTGGSGFGADLIAISMDAYFTSYAVNPRTGEEWDKGAMDDLAKHHHGRERGWVSDAITVIAANRAGDQWLVQRTYEEKWRRVTWGEPQVYSSLEEGESQGVVADALREIMVKMPTLDQLIARDGITPQMLGLSEEAGRAHMDCATVRVMRERGLEGACSLYAEEDSERARVIENSLGQFRMSP